ncbi:hypothetical protein EB815_14420 [Mesorhizobium loti]|nr:hypothetical protein EB815_14420 [Mesorhizobium loti]
MRGRHHFGIRGRHASESAQRPQTECTRAICRPEWPPLRMTPFGSAFGMRTGEPPPHARVSTMLCRTSSSSRSKDALEGQQY